MIKNKAKDSEDVLLFAIRKPYSNLIIIGEKKFELRKRPPRMSCKYALIYETSPTKAIIGYFEVNRIYVDSIEKIWEITKEGSHVSKSKFKEYYKNKKYAVAFEIKRSEKFKTPINLHKLGINRAPQDFMYVKGKELNGLIGV